MATIDPKDFSSVITNPYFPLDPGTTYVYESPDGSEVVTFAVTRETIKIMGVTCVVVVDTAMVDGEVVEITRDYFAQNIDGSVWYFGEDVRNFENGQLVDTEGTWRAGRRGAEPGIIMLADPQVGDEYDQENAPGVAEDHAKVISLTESVNVPYGSFDPALQTHETTPLEPDVLESKYYASGIGQLLTVDEAAGGEISEQLVKIRFEGTAQADTLVGKIGPDELFGFGGSDSLNGQGGNDTISGGTGNDTATGGAGDDLFVFSASDGQLTITDFVAGGNIDEIDLAGTKLGRFADVRANMSQQGNSTVINVDNDRDAEIVLQGVTPSQLSASDFNF
jgi:hypothetical protein